MKLFNINSWLRFLLRHDELFMLFVSIVVGILAGYGNLVFRYFIELSQQLFYGVSGEAMLTALQSQRGYKIILMPALGGLLVGLLGLVFKSAKGHGVPDVIKAVLLNRRISPFVAFIKTIASSLTIGSGGSAGREGPIIQIGAALGAGIGRLLRFSGGRMKTVLACGASGGLAATFNAPMGGAMFASEIIVGEFSIKTFSPIIVSSVIATVISRMYLGNDVTFAVPTYEFRNPIELIFYGILGCLVAFIGVCFIKFFYKIEDLFTRLRLTNFLKPVLGGLLLGMLGLYAKEVMGVGYTTIVNILHNRLDIGLLFALIFLKMVATSLTLASGGAGGLFVPSLFIGASTGGFFGGILNFIYPGVIANSGAYALVAMSAMLASTMRAPITAILIIFEITQSYEIILPLMIATIVSNVVSNLLYKESIFTYPLVKEGIKVKRTLEESVLESIQVKDAMLKDNIIKFKKHTPIKDIIASIQRANYSYFPVVDDNDILVGMLSLDDIRSILFDESVRDFLVADDICRRKDLSYVFPDDTLADAMAKMGLKDLGALPVVKKLDGDKLKFLGLLRRSDIIIAYNRYYSNM
ncbi:MAG: chloride channel protein [Deferribacterota bacterium]|nr:chloride channel protein [Deferribacterota bacterium]